MDMNYITEEVLTKLDACEDGKAWWLRNELSGYPVSRLREIKGDYKEYIVWLKDKFYNCTYDSYGNRLTYKDPDGYEWTKTYDSYGNLTSDDDNIYEYNRENGLILFKNGEDILSIPKFK
jgi:YD repeat-containing protein